VLGSFGGASQPSPSLPREPRVRATQSYDPASLRRYNRNSDSLIELTGPTTATHVSTWLVVMKTNVDIHMSAVGRYEDELVKRDGVWLIAKRRRVE
jgi:hypothetical protein